MTWYRPFNAKRYYRTSKVALLEADSHSLQLSAFSTVDCVNTEI